MCSVCFATFIHVYFWQCKWLGLFFVFFYTHICLDSDGSLEWHIAWSVFLDSWLELFELCTEQKVMSSGGGWSKCVGVHSF